MSQQLPLRIGFAQRALFDNFITGPNAAAVSALVDWTSGRLPGELFYLWGMHGSGRSHLLSAACDATAGAGLAFAYLPLADAALRSTEALDGLETCQLVCLDDLDAIAGDARREEAVFHLYNRVRDAGHQLLVSAGTSPAELDIRLPDLKSRLAWGTCFHLQPLDDADKRMLLRRQATERGLDLSQDAADYLLSRCPRDTAELVGLIERLDTAALAAQRRLTIPFLRSQLGGK